MSSARRRRAPALAEGPAKIVQPAAPTRRLIRQGMSQEEDLADVDAVLRGEVDRFEGIVARWERPLVNLAWRFVRNRAIAEEMAQEAFVRCFRKLRQWRRDAKFSTWLMALALNHYRSMLRKRRPTIDDEVELGALVGADGDCSELEDAERDEIVRRAVTFLPAIYRDAVVVYHFEEKDVVSASEHLGVSEGTLKSRLHRGRKMLKERLERMLP